MFSRSGKPLVANCTHQWGFREDIKDDKVEDNNKDDDNNGNGISALGLDIDLMFSRVPSCGTSMT